MKLGGKFILIIVSLGIPLKEVIILSSDNYLLKSIKKGTEAPPKGDVSVFLISPFQPSVAFHIETNHLIYK